MFTLYGEVVQGDVSTCCRKKIIENQASDMCVGGGVCGIILKSNLSSSSVVKKKQTHIKEPNPQAGAERDQQILMVQNDCHHENQNPAKTE